MNKSSITEMPDRMLAGEIPSVRLRPGSAAKLLTKVLASRAASRERLAREVGVSLETLARYESGREPIPLNHQARIALFVIANVPVLVAQGNRLRHQVAAAIAMRTREAVARDARVR